jgi:hypothetical protein
MIIKQRDFEIAQESKQYTKNKEEHSELEYLDNS